MWYKDGMSKVKRKIFESWKKRQIAYRGMTFQLTVRSLSAAVDPIPVIKIGCWNKDLLRHTETRIIFYPQILTERSMKHCILAGKKLNPEIGCTITEAMTQQGIWTISEWTWVIRINGFLCAMIWVLTRCFPVKYRITLVWCWCLKFLFVMSYSPQSRFLRRGPWMEFKVSMNFLKLQVTHFVFTQFSWRQACWLSSDP